MFYLLVIAPMDQVFVGPFASQEAANEYAKPITARNHDAYLMTEAEMLANQKAYGAVPVQEPKATQTRRKSGFGRLLGVPGGRS